MQTATTKDTRLSPRQQQQRAEKARRWAARVLALQAVSGCDIRLAVQAIAAADEEQKQ